MNTQVFRVFFESSEPFLKHDCKVLELFVLAAKCSPLKHFSLNFMYTILHLLSPVSICISGESVGKKPVFCLCFYMLN